MTDAKLKRETPWLINLELFFSWRIRVLLLILPLMFILGMGIYKPTHFEDYFTPSREAIQGIVFENVGLYGGNIYDAAVDGTTGWAYAITESDPGVYQSKDNGDHWAPLTGTSPGGSGHLHVTPDGILYVVDSEGLERTTDHGANWEHLGNFCTITSLAVDEQHFGHFLVGGRCQPGELHVTFDDAQTWITSTIPVAGNSSIYSLAIDPIHDGVIYATSYVQPGGNLSANSYIFRSTDDGISFSPVFTASVGSSVWAVAVNSEGMAIAATDSGIYRSFDGEEWSLISSLGSFIAVFHPNQPNTIYIDGHVSLDGGDNWELIGNFSSFLAISPINPQMMFTRSSIGLFRSMDGGHTWEDKNQGIQGQLITNLATDLSDSQILYVTTEKGIGRSMNGGSSWEFPIGGITVTQNTWAVTVPNVPGAAYLGNHNGQVCKTTNYGIRWNCVLVNPSNPMAVWEVAIDPGDESHLYAASANMAGPAPVAYGAIFRSLDGGETWITTTLQQAPVNTVKVGSLTNGSIIYAGLGDYWAHAVAGGIYRSLDGGESWIQSGFPDRVVTAIAVNPNDGRTVFAGLRNSLIDPDNGYLLYRSTNAGVSWQQLSLDSRCGIEVVSIDPNNTEVIYVSACSQVFRSIDGGNSWTLFYVGKRGEQFQAISLPLLPPPPIENFSAEPISDTVCLTWNSPSDPNVIGTLIRVMTDTFPANHTQGVTVTTRTTLPESSYAYTQTGVTEGTYYYSAFTYDASGHFSPPITISMTLSAQSSFRGMINNPSPVNYQAKVRKMYLSTSYGLYLGYVIYQNVYQVFLPFTSYQTLK